MHDRMPMRPAAVLPVAVIAVLGGVLTKVVVAAGSYAILSEMPEAGASGSRPAMAVLDVAP